MDSVAYLNILRVAIIPHTIHHGHEKYEDTHDLFDLQLALQSQLKAILEQTILRQVAQQAS